MNFSSIYLSKTNTSKIMSITNKSIVLNCSWNDPEKGLHSFPDNHFDYGICDIEYFIGASRPSKKPNKVRQKNGKILSIQSPNYEHFNWDDQPCLPEYFEQLFRVTKQQIIFGGNYYGLAGGYLVWDKLNGTTDQFGCEMAWLSFTKRTDIVYFMWRGMMQSKYASKDIKLALKQEGDKNLNEVRIHECQKPIKLYKFILDEYNIKGKKVLDTHLGSGSNRIANFLANNEFHAYEISPKKFQDQENRFNDFLQHKLYRKTPKNQTNLEL